MKPLETRGPFDRTRRFRHEAAGDSRGVAAFSVGPPLCCVCSALGWCRASGGPTESSRRTPSGGDPFDRTRCFRPSGGDLSTEHGVFDLLGPCVAVFSGGPPLCCVHSGLGAVPGQRRTPEKFATRPAGAKQTAWGQAGPNTPRRRLALSYFMGRAGPHRKRRKHRLVRGSRPATASIIG